MTTAELIDTAIGFRFGTIKAWLMRLFGRAATPPATPTAIPPTDHPKPARPMMRRTQTAPDKETFSDLLEGLSDSFKTMQIPAIRGNWLARRDVRALHKLGIYIPTPWVMEGYDEPTIPNDIQLPMIASCLMVGKKYDTKTQVHPRFAFAIKGVRLPPNVEHFRGTPYQFGYCVELQRDQHDDTSPPRMFWCWAWVVVDEGGRVRFCKEFRSEASTIRHKRASPGDWGRVTSSTIHARRWQTPTIAVGDNGKQDLEPFLLNVFRQLIVWWATREDRWSVGVRKDGKRATFSIAKEHTAAYFADRDRQIAVDGRAKKIIHYVAEHVRGNGSRVKAHVRGLRDFEWRGFGVAVVAPKLFGAIYTNAHLTPVEVDAGEADNGMYLDTLEVAERLAAHEDRTPQPARMIASATQGHASEI